MPSKLITVVETPLFLRQARDVWDDAERDEFVDFIARHPETGDVIPRRAACARYGGAGQEAANAAAHA